MKRTFKVPLAFVAVLFAVASAFAFRNHPAQKQGSITSYHYVGAYTNSEVSKPQNWIEEESFCGGEGDAPCSISTELDRNGFDTMVAGFTTVSDANNASTTKLYP
jgi:hypothetical protein